MATATANEATQWRKKQILAMVTQEEFFRVQRHAKRLERSLSDTMRRLALERLNQLEMSAAEPAGVEK